MDVTTTAGEATKFTIVRNPKSFDAIPTYHLGPFRQLIKISIMIVNASTAVKIRMIDSAQFCLWVLSRSATKNGMIYELAYCISVFTAMQVSLEGNSLSFYS